MEAAVVGLDMPDSYYDEFRAHYAHMKKLFTDGLKRIGIPFTASPSRVRGIDHAIFSLIWLSRSRASLRVSSLLAK